MNQAYLPSAAPVFPLMLVTLLVAAGVLSGCGGGSSATPAAAIPAPAPAPTYLLGGIVSGMPDGASVIVSNGGDMVTVAANGAFVLPTRLAGGAAYSITSSAPAAHGCAVGEGAGTVGAADVSKIVIACKPFLLAGKERLAKHLAAVAVDAAGFTYVLDAQDQVILRVGSAGNFSVFAGSRNVSGHQDGTGAAASFYTNADSRMAFDPHGNLMLTDTCNGLVRKISPAGVVSTLAGRLQNNCSVNPAAHPALPPVDGTGTGAVLAMPAALAVDTGGNVVVGDAAGGGLRRISAAGVVTTENPLAAEANTVFSAMTHSADGTLYLSSNSNGQRRIWRVVAGKAVMVSGGAGVHGIYPPNLPAVAANYNAIGALTADKRGNIYIADVQTLRRLTPAGVVEYVAGARTATFDGTANFASFSTIAALAPSNDDKLVVLESDTSQLRLVTPDAVVTTFAATPAPREYADGKGAAARFDGSVYLAGAADGTLYALDSRRQVVRKIAADGTVSLFAGVAGVAATTGASDGPAVGAALWNPAAIAVDGAGALFLIDGNGLRKVAGGNITTIKQTSAYQYNYFMRVLPAGGFVTTDYQKVSILDASGEVKKVIDAPTIATALGLPTAGSEAAIASIEVDGAGNIYIVDAWHAVVLKYGAEGKLSHFAGTVDVDRNADGAIGTGSLSFEGGTDMTADAAGNLYLSGHGAVRKINPQGVISTPALAWGNPGIYSIVAKNGMLYGGFPAGILQTPLP